LDGRFALVIKKKGLIGLGFQNFKAARPSFFKSYQYFGRCVKRCCSKSFLLITSYPSVREGILLDLLSVVGRADSPFAVNDQRGSPARSRTQQAFAGSRG
jgi:hypothetical protein